MKKLKFKVKIQMCHIQVRYITVRFNINIVDLNDLKGTKYGTGGKLLLMFTCDVCQTKQGRTFSKDAYTKGVVLIRCEGCDNLHLIADNLGWFEDEATNIEQIMKEKGEKVLKFINQESLEFIQEKDIDKNTTENIEHDDIHRNGCCWHEGDD